jgi:hypothetical protein
MYVCMYVCMYISGRLNATTIDKVIKVLDIQDSFLSYL